MSKEKKEIHSSLLTNSNSSDLEVDKKEHYCLEWDGLLINEDDLEFEACLCYK